MLWSWNCFLAAAPYFLTRFRSSQSISENFQSIEIAVSTSVNLISIIALTKLQKNANYPKRIGLALLINTVVFAFVALFTAIPTTALQYLVFLLVVIVATSFATALIQNGLFAYASGIGIPQLISAIMVGQAVAGVLPPLAQVVSVFTLQPTDNTEQPEVRSASALSYFLTAVVVSILSLLAFLSLLSRHPPVQTQSAAQDAAEPEDAKPSIPLLVLARKLFWQAAAVFLVFCVTLAVLPVITLKISSVSAGDSRLLQPASFIALGFLFWNFGDLLGRLASGVQTLSIVSRPRAIFALSVLRIGWIPLYFLCNIRGRGAIISSDMFYLLVVQLGFGLSNGYLGSVCMSSTHLVEEHEREAAGGFMSLALTSGLTVGSLASFLFANI